MTPLGNWPETRFDCLSMPLSECLSCSSTRKNDRSNRYRRFDVDALSRRLNLLPRTKE